MKPTLLCGKCKHELRWGDRFCGRCGEAIDWPSDIARAATSEAQAPLTGNDPKEEGTKEHRQAGPVDGAGKRHAGHPFRWSWKMAAGFLLFFGGGVLLLELATSKRITPPAGEHDDHVAHAHAEALPMIEELEKKVAANPSDHESLLKLANLLHDSRMYEKAISRYEEYLQHYPDDANARVDLGICYFDLDKLEEAKRQIHRALQVEPGHVLAHFNMGIVYLRQRDLKTANEWFRKTIELDPTGPAGRRAKEFLAEHSP
jgi:cytochrome c-type biogenesis protein CcmH/NrfG